MSLPIALLSWTPVLAALPSDPAQRIGYIVGVLLFIACFLAVFVFGIVAIIMAFVKRTTGWIIAGSISGILIGGVGLVTVGGFVMGFKKGYEGALQKRALKTGVPEVITGKVVPYTIAKPGDWSVKRDVGAYDSLLSDSKGYVGIIAEKVTLESSEALARFAHARCEKMGTDVTFSNTETVNFDGRDWLAFTVRAKMQELPFTYQYYVYSGKEGSVQIMGWAFQKDWETEKTSLDPVMRTVHLPAATP